MIGTTSESVRIRQNLLEHAMSASSVPGVGTHISPTDSEVVDLCVLNNQVKKLMIKMSVDVMESKSADSYSGWRGFNIKDSGKRPSS